MNSLLLIINTLLIMTHTLPPLPYAMDALAPKMSKETLEYHYGKHLQTYIDNLNNLIKGTPYENMTLEEISVKADGPIYNNGAQAWNHAFFFNSFSPTPKSAPEGALAEAIKRDFGSFDAFKEQFGKAAIGLPGPRAGCHAGIGIAVDLLSVSIIQDGGVCLTQTEVKVDRFFENQKRARFQNGSLRQGRSFPLRLSFLAFIVGQIPAGDVHRL